MNDSQAIQPSGSGANRVAADMQEQEDLWRRAQGIPIPLSEKIAHVLFAATVIAFYYFGSNETSPIIMMLMWFVAFHSSQFRRQQTQIDALRELLWQATARR